MKTILRVCWWVLIGSRVEGQVFSLQDFATLYHLQGEWTATWEKGRQVEHWSIEGADRLEGRIHRLDADQVEIPGERLGLFFYDHQIWYVAQRQFEGPNDTFLLSGIDQGDYIFENRKDGVHQRVVYHAEADSVLEKYLEAPWISNPAYGTFIYRKTTKPVQNGRFNPEYLLRKAKALTQESPFQKEIDGILPQRLLFQDSLVTVLRSISPQMPVHLLVVPNHRMPTLNDATVADEQLLGHMLLTARDMARKTGIAESGYRLAFNTNEDAGQSAFHLHLHVLGGARTGAMVDPAWRSVQRRLADSTRIAPFEKCILGVWISQNTHATVTLKWEPDLQNKFIALSYRQELRREGASSEIFEGKAFFKQSSALGYYTANWMDSTGDVFPLEARYDGREMTVQWRNTGHLEGKTVYRFLDQQTIELTDLRKQDDGTWKVFDRLVLSKQKF